MKCYGACRFIVFVLDQHPPTAFWCRAGGRDVTTQIDEHTAVGNRMDAFGAPIASDGLGSSPKVENDARGNGAHPAVQGGRLTRTYRALVMDRDEGRVVAMTDMAPFRAARQHLLMAIGFAELAGIFASVVVVAVFSRRSARPLAQALALQRRFVADASHELRAPLTVLHTRAQLLLHRANSADATSVRADAEALVKDTRALGAIVEDLLASAMMPLGKPVHDPVDLVSVASSVCESMAPHAGELGVQIACSCETGASASAFEVIGSEAALRRVFTSLIDNSLAHSKDNGSVDVRLRREDATVVVTVTDDGAGIDAEVLKTLFARFSQGPEKKSLQSRQGRQSYGIGLALVREVVQGHGGEITVSSSPGQRATFTMVFPAAP